MGFNSDKIINMLVPLVCPKIIDNIVKIKQRIGFWNKRNVLSSEKILSGLLSVEKMNKVLLLLVCQKIIDNMVNMEQSIQL